MAQSVDKSLDNLTKSVYVTLAKLDMTSFTWVLWNPVFNTVAFLGDSACSTDINKLLQLQNCAARRVGNRNFSTLIRSLVKELDRNTNFEFVDYFLVAI